MTVEGTVVNGKILFDAGITLPEGTRVRIAVADADDDIGYCQRRKPTRNIGRRCGN